MSHRLCQDLVQELLREAIELALRASTPKMTSLTKTNCPLKIFQIKQIVRKGEIPRWLMQISRLPMFLAWSQKAPRTRMLSSKFTLEDWPARPKPPTSRPVHMARQMSLTSQVGRMRSQLHQCSSKTLKPHQLSKTSSTTPTQSHQWSNWEKVVKRGRFRLFCKMMAFISRKESIGVTIQNTMITVKRRIFKIQSKKHRMTLLKTLQLWRGRWGDQRRTEHWFWPKKQPWKQWNVKLNLKEEENSRNYWLWILNSNVFAKLLHKSGKIQNSITDKIRAIKMSLIYNLIIIWTIIIQKWLKRLIKPPIKKRPMAKQVKLHGALRRTWSSSN